MNSMGISVPRCSYSPQSCAAYRLPGRLSAALAAAASAALLLSGCVAPISADRVTLRQAYEQVDANALRTGKPSASTAVVLHRYGLDHLAEKHMDQAVRELHEKALQSGERDLLFALSEASYVAAEQIRRSVKAWDQRDPRDFYLGSAVYAWLFLFGDSRDPLPSAFDRRFRVACDLYNCSLGVALTDSKSTNAVIKAESSRRRLPVGELEVISSRTGFPPEVQDFAQVLMADQYKVRGLSVRNREPGIGVPVICVERGNIRYGVPRCVPGTVVLRGPSSLAALSARTAQFPLELHAAYGASPLQVGNSTVPLEVDMTAYRAYTLTSSRVWKIGRLQFLAPAERIPNQLILSQPFDPKRIPVVFVHGTFSSPVTWAEMANTLTADPVLRERFQVWTFIYGSGNPLAQSISDLRASLVKEVQQQDPEGTNAALRNMVIIGHSQGGLLTKGTAIHSEDKLWRVFSTNRLEDLNISSQDQEALQSALFLKPLPFVKRVVFVATPHRGSYLAGGLARRLAQRLVSLPGAMVARGSDVLKFATGSETGNFLKGKMPTSLDGMSPRNPALLAMADIPVAPEVHAHSIIPVLGKGDCRDGGRDGVVAYSSAHLDGVESEYIVRFKHSCLNHPATIEEVRRILYEHLNEKR